MNTTVVEFDTDLVTAQFHHRAEGAVNPPALHVIACKHHLCPNLEAQTLVNRQIPVVELAVDFPVIGVHLRVDLIKTLLVDVVSRLVVRSKCDDDTVFLARQLDTLVQASYVLGCNLVQPDVFQNMEEVLVAILAFGFNSGAYVAEIIRSGIMSIDPGQFEAGRSLGFNYAQTMIYIIIPQAFKNVLPALANEFIVLIKETSVSGYIGLQDLTKGGDIIRSRTYTAFMPLLAVAIIYLVIVMFFTRLVGILERRLRNSER